MSLLQSEFTPEPVPVYRQEPAPNPEHSPVLTPVYPVMTVDVECPASPVTTLDVVSKCPASLVINVDASSKLFECSVMASDATPEGPACTGSALLRWLPVQSAPSWPPTQPAPPWPPARLAQPAPPWPLTLSALPWPPALPWIPDPPQSQVLVPLHGPGPPSLPLFCLQSITLDCCFLWSIWNPLLKWRALS
ncbi:hypothetical protein PO909_015195 [Leuciscus waleckii]